DAQHEKRLVLARLHLTEEIDVLRHLGGLKVEGIDSLIVRQVHLHAQKIHEDFLLVALRFQNVLTADDKRCHFPPSLELVKVLLEALGVVFSRACATGPQHRRADCQQEPPHDRLLRKTDTGCFETSSQGYRAAPRNASAQPPGPPAETTTLESRQRDPR